MELALHIEGDRHLAQQIYTKLREGVVSGRLVGGEKLPSTRELASRLGVSRTTVNEAFQRLLSEGYLEAQRGSGTFVTQAVRFSTDAAGSHREGAALLVSKWFKKLPRVPALISDTAGQIDFRPGLPDVRSFPFEDWRRMLAHEMRADEAAGAGYSDSNGLLSLRREIAKRIRISRAVLCEPDDIVVTSGAQQGLELIARAIIDPGSVVAIEDPGYLAARWGFIALGARVVPVPVDDEGLVVSRLPETARLIYVTPSHQFPLGPVMSFARRQALLTWAQARGAIVVEDDYDSEFRYGGRPLESLKGMDRNDVVAYVGTFSKSLLPGLRLGYLIPPTSLHAGLCSAKWLADRNSPAVVQATMAGFMSSGLYARYLKKMQKIYESRYELATRVIGSLEHLGLSLVPSLAGLHVSALFKPHMNVERITERARAAGLGVHALAPFYMEKPRQGFIFGFGNCDIADLEAGLDRFVRVLKQPAAGPARRR